MYLRLVLVAFFVTTTIGGVSGQLRTGVKAGLSTLYVDATDQTILDSMGTPEYQLGVHKTKLGLHIGFFVQVSLGSVLFIQPELLFNSQTVEYKFTTIQEPQEETIREENYQTLDIPVIIGFRLQQVRFGVGPIAHLRMNLNSDIDNDVDDEEFLNESYTVTSQTLAWGWQAGIGIDIWQLHLDARYEGNFEEFGSHMNFYGRPYSFGVKPGRLIISVGISF